MRAIPASSSTRWLGTAVLVGLTCWGWFAAQTSAARDSSPHSDKIAPQGQPGSHEPADSVKLVAAAIDRHIAARWTEENVPPAPAADDAEFLRRTYLNIVGRIPTASEAQLFLDESGTAKRSRLVEDLLASAAYPTHLADMLRSVIVPEVNADPALLQQSERFERWLRTRLAENAGYDRIVTELLTQGPRSADAQFYYLAKGNKPENLAAGVSRVFLGVRIECAQCHNHPFAKWHREQFWQLAAFFAGVEPESGSMMVDRERVELPIPGTGKKVVARFLDGEDPAWKTVRRQPRTVLAEWITGPRNPYFARAAANRIWAQLMGTGLVDPVDDFDESNPPSHPEILDLLADEFAHHKYDVRFLIRAICASHTYQLSSAQTDPRQANRRLFARAPIKGLTPTELAASLSLAIGEPEETGPMQPGFALPDPNSSRLKPLVMELFKNENADPVDSETTILQALALMNSSVMDASTAPGRGNTLAALLDAPFLDTAGRVETLYLCTLSRRPTAAESTRLIDYVEHGGAHTASKPKLGNVFQQMITTDRSKTRSDHEIALGDVFWALLNSSEFLTNH
ncbi:MAG TPA: DUF1549 and DUF1553 domain-containing protein [Planctomycetaceae bacterium]|nr:DUF1549 and DUF1553 domain-containing protein [Planctomycetaceae bacterium]